MKSQPVVFTPLRIALMIAICIANILAIVSMVVEPTPWSEALSIFSVVFILLFVFVILLEIVWLHHRAKSMDDKVVISKYRSAKLIYSILFILGFAIVYWVLMT